MTDRADTHVDLVPYDAEWPKRFAAAAAEIRAVLPDAVIEHVGSTSVIGLSSKDTIDIAVGVPDVHGSLVPDVLGPLESAGFALIPESFASDPDHSFLHRIVNDHRADHVHLMRIGSDRFNDRLLFRDYLRAVPAAARHYESAKLELAARFSDRRSSYVDQKSFVVEKLMHEARSWRRSSASGV